MNKKDQALYAEYESILVRKKKNFSSSLFPTDNPALSKANAIETFRYAFEKFLKWEPQDVVAGLTPDVLKMMKLQTLVKYLEIPEDFNTGLHARYIAHLLYPDIIPYDDVDTAVEMYQKVLSGEMKNFPKKFFYNNAGTTRAIACFNYALREKLEFSSVQEIYEFLLDKDGIRKITNLGLGLTLNIFDTPIDLVHESLPEFQRDEFLYQYCKFKYCYQRTRVKNTKGSPDSVNPD